MRLVRALRTSFLLTAQNANMSKGEMEPRVIANIQSLALQRRTNRERPLRSSP